MPVSEFSVSDAPLRNTGTVHTTRLRPRGGLSPARYTTTSIGSALSVIATKPGAFDLRRLPDGHSSVGVVPDPALNWPGFCTPLLRYFDFHTTFGFSDEPARDLYIDLSVTM